MRASHRCDTCQGEPIDGRIYVDRNGECCENCGAVHTDERGPYLYSDRQTFVLRCKPCLYAVAHLVDPMPVADALADAETLARALMFNGPDMFAYVGSDIAEAERIGRSAIWHYNRSHVRDAARTAARFAFRAVPGLRG